MARWAKSKHNKMLMVLIIFQCPPLLQAEILSGCLVKEKGYISGGTRIGKFDSNLAECAEACTKKIDCHLFEFNNLKECSLYRKGEVVTSVRKTAGFCPKAKSRQRADGFEGMPVQAELKCST